VDCSWEGTTGFAVGDLVQNLSLQGCDGRAVQLHDVCGAAASVVFGVYGWCPPCMEHISLLEPLREGRDLNALIAIIEDPLGVPATVDYCAQVRDLYGMEAIWTADPEGAMAGFGGPGTVLVLDAEGIIRLARDDATDDAITAAVDEALAR